MMEITKVCGSFRGGGILTILNVVIVSWVYTYTEKLITLYTLYLYCMLTIPH